MGNYRKEKYLRTKRIKKLRREQRIVHYAANGDKVTACGLPPRNVQWSATAGVVTCAVCDAIMKRGNTYRPLNPINREPKHDHQT